MEYQDWTTVVLKRRTMKRDTSANGVNGANGANGVNGMGLDSRDSHRNERSRLAKIADMDYTDAPKKQVISESLQDLIRKRMELKLSQDKADQLCNFPRHTFRGIESRRILPSSSHQIAIQNHLGVQLKITTK